MRKFLLILTIFSCFATVILANTGNLIRNPGFEEVGSDAWGVLPQNWSYSNDVAHSGQRSLHVNVTSPDQYSFPFQITPCRSGTEYTLSFYVKTENVVNHNPQASFGATACIEYYNNDKYLGGIYDILGLVGTNDWTKISTAFTVHEDIGEGGHITLVLYLRKGYTGKVWFDDVEIREKEQPILQCRFFSPKYRTMHLSNNTINTEILTRINLHPGVALPLNWFITVELYKLGEEECLQKFKLCKLQKENFFIRYTFDSIEEDVPHKLAVSLMDDGDIEPKLIDSKEFDFINISQEKISTTTMIDEKGNLIVDGSPFFPIGWLVSGNPLQLDTFLPDLQQLSAASFNVVMNYGINCDSLDAISRYLDLFSAYQVKVIYSLKDFHKGTLWYKDRVGPFQGPEDVVKGLVTTFKDHPAILAWYIADELSGRITDIERHNKWVWDIDYRHPTWLVSCFPQELEMFDFAVDILGVDPYPIPEASISLVSDWVNKAYEVQSNNKPVWAVIQAYAKSHFEYGRREPTMEEMKAMSYLALVNGAKGLFYYSLFNFKESPDYQERWESICEINNEIQELVPFFLNGQRVRLNGLTEGFEAALFKKEQERYLIVINYTDQNKEFRINVNEIGEVTRVQEKSGNRELPLIEDVFVDTFGPFAVHIYNIY